MKLLDRYIAKTILIAIGLVTLMLVGLHVFILFVNQMDDLGKGDYGIWQAAWVVMLDVPYQIYLFFPVASLLGCLVGLGSMAGHRELIVMRASGVSIARITYAVVKAAFLLIFCVTLLGETVVPSLSMLAKDRKMQALSGGQSVRTAEGVWFRQDNDFIMINQVLSEHHLQGVHQFHFDAHHHLKVTRLIDTVNYIDGQWVAMGIQETQLGEGKTKALKRNRLLWDVQLNPDLLRVSQEGPDEMNLYELHRSFYSAHEQLSFTYQLAYWQRLIQPLTTLVMMVLAIPFIFGPLRSSTMGAKLLIGASIGFGFHMINQFFGPVCQVFQWSPEVAAFAPTLVFAVFGLYLMRRVS